MLKFRHLDHLVDDLQRFGRLSFLARETFEHFNVLLKKSCRAKSRQPVTRMHETVETVGSGLGTVQRPGNKLRGVM